MLTSSLAQTLGFSSGRTQNPPVLWLTESACSRPEQPLSATHGRQRDNTLDLARKIVCHETPVSLDASCHLRVLPSIGFLPLRQRAPFGIPSRFERSTHKGKMVCGRSFQNEKIPQTILQHEKEGLWDSLCRTHRRTWENCASCTAAALHRSEHTPMFRWKETR